MRKSKSHSTKLQSILTLDRKRIATRKVKEILENYGEKEMLCVVFWFFPQVYYKVHDANLTYWTMNVYQ